MSEHDEVPEWNAGCFKFLGFALIVFIIVFIFVSDFKSSMNNRDGCEDVGGEYKVIGQEFSAAHRTTVDVYGCVK